MPLLSMIYIGLPGNLDEGMEKKVDAASRVFKTGEPFHLPALGA